MAWTLYHGNRRWAPVRRPHPARLLAWGTLAPDHMHFCALQRDSRHTQPAGVLPAGNADRVVVRYLSARPHLRANRRPRQSHLGVHPAVAGLGYAGPLGGRIGGDHGAHRALRSGWLAIANGDG